MISFYVVCGAAAAALFFFLGKNLYGRYRRKKLFSQPFPDEWNALLENNIAILSILPGELKKQLLGHVQVFLSEKTFEGCGGLEITDEIRVTIAAQACMLLLNRKTDYFPGLSSVVVYPHAYVGKDIQFIGDQATETKSVRAGESWTGGAVVLAWDHVKHGAWDMKDGHNVVFHEFAHQLDQEDGASDGAPILEKTSAYAPWARILGAEFSRLREKALRGGRTVMDEYGTTNPAEFFAVATESFFEKAGAMKRHHPELYEELKQFYRMDPASWK